MSLAISAVMYYDMGVRKQNMDQDDMKENVK